MQNGRTLLKTPFSRIKKLLKLTIKDRDITQLMNLERCPLMKVSTKCIHTLKIIKKKLRILSPHLSPKRNKKNVTLQKDPHLIKKEKIHTD